MRLQISTHADSQWQSHSYRNKIMQFLPAFGEVSPNAFFFMCSRSIIPSLLCSTTVWTLYKVTPVADISLMNHVPTPHLPLVFIRFSLEMLKKNPPQSYFSLIVNWIPAYQGSERETLTKIFNVGWSKKKKKIQPMFEHKHKTMLSSQEFTYFCAQTP